MEIVNTVLLDNVDSGAANPWGARLVRGRPDRSSSRHAGTHEISVIDFPALLAKLATLPTELDGNQGSRLQRRASRVQADVPNDLAFLVGVRQRIRFPEADRGPRAVVLVGAKALRGQLFLRLAHRDRPRRAPTRARVHPAGAEAGDDRRAQGRVLLQRRDASAFKAGKAAPVAIRATRAWTA